MQDARDGRHLRSERSRLAVIDALLDRLARGEAVPSTKEIARAAGMTERTLFNLFEDKSALLWAAVARFRQRALARLPDVPADGDTPRERLERLLCRLGPFLDEYAAVRWAALTHGDEVPDLRRGVVLGALLDRVSATWADARLDPLDDEALHALRALIDPITWRQLRVYQRLGRERAARVLARMILAVRAGGEAPE